MYLTKREIDILKLLMERKEVKQSELSVLLKMKKSNISKYLKGLLVFGLVDIINLGNKNIVKISQTFFSEYNKLKIHKNKELIYNALIGKVPFLLSYFYKNAPIDFKIRDISISISTAKRILNRLRNLGIIFMRKKGIYQIREEMESLTVFCRNIIYSMNLEIARNVFNSTSSFFVDVHPTELAVLVVTESVTDSKLYTPTSYDVFHKYGINLILTKRHYYTNIKPKIEDIIIHTLVLALTKLPKPLMETRGIIYTCALIIKNEVKYKNVLKAKYKFGLEERGLNNIFEFIESKGEKTFQGFPSWKEVEDVAYG